jgi:hypothetical protein
MKMFDLVILALCDIRVARVRLRVDSFTILKASRSLTYFLAE